MNNIKLDQINPVFICGFPSGGTDLLKTILNAHPLIHISSEMPFLYYLPKYGYSSASTFECDADIEALRKLLRRFDVWSNLENIESAVDIPSGRTLAMSEVLRCWFNHSTKPIWGNKTPQNTEHISELRSLFSKPKFILITRDVRDVCLSWRNKWGKNVFLCSLKWGRRMRSGYDELEKLNHEDGLILKYEDLVSDIKGTSQILAQFLGIDYSNEMVNFHKHVKIKFDGKINYGEPIKTSNTAKWKLSLSRSEIKRIEQYSHDTMELLGYQPEYATQQATLPLISRLIYNVKDVYATAVHGNKYSKFNGIAGKIKAVAIEAKKIFY